MCISGLLVRPEVIEPPPVSNAELGIRLHPLHAYAMLGNTMELLTDITVDLRDLPSQEAALLVDRCASVEGPERRLRAAAQWVTERVRRGQKADPGVAWMARTIERRRDSVSMGELACQTGWSRTRITNTFRAQIGVTPKLFARIVRFGRALELVQQRHVSLSAVALEAGYYDQPQFNADFLEMSGFTPGVFRDARRFPASTSLAEPAP